MSPVIIDFNLLTDPLKQDIKTLHRQGIISNYQISRNQLILTPINMQSIVDIGVVVGRHPETSFMYDYLDKK